MYQEMEKAHPKLSRGIVWCTVCKRSELVKSSNALGNGWPMCCGYTMTIDNPEERKSLIGSDGDE